jgi:DNA-binding HxlR family transcriptional regulator
MLTKDELPECPVATTVQLIGNKWKLLIIRNLLESPQRFSQLKESLEGISQKVLSDNLRSLVDDGLVKRDAYAEVPPKVIYSLSDLGNSLRPIIESMRTWGIMYKELKNNK